MKSTPVSAPPAPTVAVPSPENALLEQKRALVEANGPSRSPTRLPKAARWSKRTKILLSLGIVGLFLGGVGIMVYIMVAKPFRDVRADLITHKVGYGRLEL